MGKSYTALGIATALGLLLSTVAGNAAPKSLADVLALEEIKQVKARYFRCIDTKDWECFSALFAQDAVLDFRLGAGTPARGEEWVFRGIDVIKAMPKKFGFTDVNHLTTHHGFMPEIEITSATTARGIWAMEDDIDDTEPGGRRILRGKGYYYDTYEKIGGRWVIKTQRLERIRREFITMNPYSVSGAAP